MRHLRALPLLLAGLLALSPIAAAEADDAAALFDKGLAELTQGDFSGAMKAFGGAAKANPDEQNYRQHYALVRRIIQVRPLLDEPMSAEEWDQIARSLRAFYYSYGIQEEALALDRRRHEKLGTIATTIDLAQSLLELDRNAEAAELLGRLGEGKATPRTNVLLGIALAREGETEKAMFLAKLGPRPSPEKPRLAFDQACLSALLNQPAQAADCLTLCFEATPPGELESLKRYAKNRKDLAPLVASAKFDKVWSTASQVKAAGCGSGGGCGSCPSKAGCSSDQKEQPAGCGSGAGCGAKDGEGCSSGEKDGCDEH